MNRRFFSSLALVFMVLCLLCGQILHAQKRSVDSLTALLITAQQDTMRVNILSDLCWHLRYRDYVISARYGLEALELAEKLKFQAGVLRTLNFIGVVYRNAKLYPQALEYFTRALDEATKQQDRNQSAFAMNNMGDVYNHQQKYDSAKVYVRRALALFEQLQDVKGMEYCLVRMGEIALASGDSAHVMDYYFRRKQLVEQRLPKKLPDAWLSILATYSILRQDSMVIRLFPQAFVLIKGTEHEAAILSVMARVYFRQGDTAKAEPYLLQIMSLRNNRGLQASDVRDELSWLADIHARRGEFAEAYRYRTEALEAKDFIQKASDQRAIAQAQMSYETAKRTEQTLLYSKQQQLQLLVIVVVSLALIFAVAFGIVLVRSNRRTKRDNELLAQQTERFRAISRIGAEISSSLVFVDVVLTIYQEVNNQMDAPIFNIGVYLPEEERIEFRYLIENGNFLPPPSVMMSDTARPAVQCVLKRQEIVLNDVDIPVLVGSKPESLVYVPLVANDRVIGVFSVQSYHKNSYSEENVALLQAISSHVAIAMENVHAFERIHQQRAELAVEREKSEKLLLNILPPSIAARMKDDQTKIADYFDAVSVMFIDIVGFTTFSRDIGADVLVEMLDNLFSQFDAIMQKYGLEKIKTIGDAYMAASGIPTKRNDHTEAMAQAALDIIALVGNQVRIGIHTGAVIAGVIGTSKFAYDLWGDTVNTASRMESHGEAGRIHVTEEVYRRLSMGIGHSSLGVRVTGEHPPMTNPPITNLLMTNDKQMTNQPMTNDRFTFEERGDIEVKGKGVMRTYFLTGME